MAERYILIFTPLRLALAALAISIFLVLMDLSVARELNANRLRRDIIYLTSTCPPVQGGHRLVSTVLTTAQGQKGPVPAKLRCIYTFEPIYGKPIRTIVLKNQ